MAETIPQGALPAVQVARARPCPLCEAQPGPLCQAKPAGDQLAILGQALADAIEYRQPAGLCADCDDHPAGLCTPHAADLDRADDYAALARQLGTEADL
jgi:hypothetical protein